MAERDPADVDFTEIDLPKPLEVVDAVRMQRIYADGISSIITGRHVVKVLFNEELPTGGDANERSANLLLTLPRERFISMARTLAALADRLTGNTNAE